MTLRPAILSLLAAGLLALTPPALAVNPDEILADPALEARARDLSKDLRCVVCRNQSIDDSNAGIARDMRVVLRERLVAGDTDDEALAFLVDRYGAYILLNPPVTPVTYALWGGPALLLLLAILGFARFWRRKPTAEPDDPGFTDADRAMIRAALYDDEAR